MNRHVRQMPAANALRLVALAALLVTTSACTPSINTQYGRAAGAAADSVNGTGVLAEMYRQAGYTVESRASLTPRARRAEVIVWIPDDFKPPDSKVIDWFNEWLSQPGKTLVYVGRDYDAAPLYWREAASMAPADEAKSYNRMLKEAKIDEAGNRAAAPSDGTHAWFDIQNPPPRKVQTLEGPWADNVDPGDVQIELSQLLTPKSDEAEVLLASTSVEGSAVRTDILASRYEGFESNSSLILINNGSFLLNFALVNREHRKLAQSLIEETEPSLVVFLESGSSGPRISSADTNPATRGDTKIFSVWPMNFILLHLAAMGIIFCFARFPIFGSPRSLPTRATVDFERHVGALGQLIGRTRDRNFALQRVATYLTSTTKANASGSRHSAAQNNSGAQSPKDAHQ